MLKVLEDNEIELKTENSNIINDYIIYIKETNECVGYVKYRGYHHDIILGDMGAIIYPKYRGHNYTAKAIRLISRHLNENGIDNFWLTCKKDNIASFKTIKSIGKINIERTINNDILFFECQTLEKEKTNKKQFTK